MRKWKGFTLIELIIVIIVIGILAAVAVPQYLTATERAQAGKARSNIGLIAQAEKIYRAEMDTYIIVANDAANATLGNFVELNAVDADTNWSYTVAAGGSGITTSFTVSATRTSGSNNGETLTLDELGAWGGNFTP
jgi:prepilin-type N-terminal cleavage/methylation domain-containing protein